MKSCFFDLRWRNPYTGYEFETGYCYESWGEAKGYTRKGWILSCIAFGKSNGFEYLGMVKEQEGR